jgi:uncharacterized membrane protein YqjE
MGAATPPSAGILESLRRLGQSAIALLQNRLALLSLELEEQKVRVVRLLLLAGAAIFLGNTALLTLSATLIVLIGQAARVPVLVALSLLSGGGSVWAFVALRRELRNSPPPFQETISELKKDTDLLNPED